MVRHLCCAAVLAVGAVTLPGAAAAQADDDPLTLTVSPFVMSAKDSAVVYLRVEPDVRSRSMTIDWFGEGGGGSHLITLEGERAAIRHRFELKRLDAGEYNISAMLLRSDGTRVIRVTRLIVLSCGCPSSSEPSAPLKRSPLRKGRRG
jgi:hypothetical protein